jgi:hypothetical protein
MRQVQRYPESISLLHGVRIAAEVMAIICSAEGLSHADYPLLEVVGFLGREHGS